MNISFVDLHAQYLSIKEEIDAAIAQVIAQSAFLRGPQVLEFEENFSRKIDVKHTVSCANGTDALYIALKALGAGPGDEVITTAHSWISTSEAITQTGAKVVFCDTHKDDFLIDVSQVEKLVNEKTKGILPVHLYGQAVDMDPLKEIAKKHHLWILEDCAQAHFAKYKDQFVGTFGDAATFSFYPGKNLGAMGDAGCIVTARSDLAEHMELFARHGGKGNHKIEGINSRMDGLQAAVLNVKLKYIDNWTEKRRKAARSYDKLLSEIRNVAPPKVHESNKHVYHLYVIKAEKRNSLREFLDRKGIKTVLNYPTALPFLQAYEYLGHKHSDFPCAKDNQECILSLPLYPEISEEEINYVADCIKAFYQT
jgi:dTDP-4-amino-4,6-dideoxygalactose transaminase